MKTINEKNHNNKFVKLIRKVSAFKGKQDLSKQIKNSLGHPFSQNSFFNQKLHYYELHVRPSQEIKRTLHYKHKLNSYVRKKHHQRSIYFIID